MVLDRGWLFGLLDHHFFMGGLGDYISRGDGRICHRAGRKLVITISGRYKERAMTKGERCYLNHMPLYLLIPRMDAGDLPLVIRDGAIWGCEMDMQELNIAKKKARSFPELIPPNRARYIGYLRHRTGRYMYWKDFRGNYWYDTEKGMILKQEMEERQKERKKKRERKKGVRNDTKRSIRKTAGEGDTVGRAEGRENDHKANERKAVWLPL